MACFHTAEFYQASVINFQETSSQGNMLNQSLLMKSAKARMWKLYRTNNQCFTTLMCSIRKKVKRGDTSGLKEI